MVAILPSPVKSSEENQVWMLHKSERVVLAELLGNGRNEEGIEQFPCDPEGNIVLRYPVKEIIFPYHSADCVKGVGNEQHDVDENALHNECCRSGNDETGGVKLYHRIETKIRLMKDPVDDEENDEGLEECRNQYKTISPIEHCAWVEFKDQNNCDGADDKQSNYVAAQLAEGAKMGAKFEASRVPLLVAVLGHPPEAEVVNVPVVLVPGLVGEHVDPLESRRQQQADLTALLRQSTDREALDPNLAYPATAAGRDTGKEPCHAVGTLPILSRPLAGVGVIGDVSKGIIVFSSIFLVIVVVVFGQILIHWVASAEGVAASALIFVLSTVLDLLVHTGVTANARSIEQMIVLGPGPQNFVSSPHPSSPSDDAQNYKEGNAQPQANPCPRVHHPRTGILIVVLEHPCLIRLPLSRCGCGCCCCCYRALFLFLLLPNSVI
mmetsp:Transcript_13459/g.38464  ORF Transcript_13459/g.38464 Transcript_13459/m.38464 type:complete len:437 (-) Transcript_13459:1618-2928(-)